MSVVEERGPNGSRWTLAAAWAASVAGAFVLFFVGLWLTMSDDTSVVGGVVGVLVGDALLLAGPYVTARRSSRNWALLLVAVVGAVIVGVTVSGALGSG